MAAIPKFSFSGWTSSRIAPQVNPATVPPPTATFSSAADIRKKAMAGGFTPAPPKEALERIKALPGGVQAWAKAIMSGKDPQIGTSTDPINAVAKPLSDTTSMLGTGTGTLVGTTNTANTDLPGWLQSEVDRLNAQDALRTQMAGQVTGGATAPPAFDPNLGVAAVTNARANYNAQINQVNEQARLQNLIQQRNQIRPGGFGFTNPFDVNRLIGLGNQIQDYQNVNLPLAASAVSGQRRNASGWLSSPWA